MASNSIGIIDTKVKDKRIIEVINVYEGLKEMLEKTLTAFVDGKTDERNKQINDDRLNKIKAIFA